MRFILVVVTVMATTVPAFADVSNIGQNLGTWGLEQIFWVALAIIAWVVMMFVMKKAWVPCFIFILVGGSALFIIKYPDKLVSIGQVIYGIATR